VAQSLNEGAQDVRSSTLCLGCGGNKGYIGCFSGSSLLQCLSRHKTALHGTYKCLMLLAFMGSTLTAFNDVMQYY